MYQGQQYPPPNQNQQQYQNAQPGYPQYGQGPPGYPPPQGSGMYPPPAYPPPNAGGGHSGGYQKPGYNPPPPPTPKHTFNVEEPQEDPEFAGTSFSDRNIRRMFIRKVYLILMTQLGFTTGVIAVFVFVDPVKMFVRENRWLYYVSYGVFLVTYISLVCCPGVRRKFPGNFIALAIFTIAMSYMTGCISSYHDTDIVLIAIGITTAVCLLVTIFAMQTKCDFTKWGGILFVCSMVMMLFGILCIFLYNRIMHLVYSALIALLFTAFLAYDTQKVMGGKKFELSPEEYIVGALQIYLDIVYIFTAIMSISSFFNR